MYVFVHLDVLSEFVDLQHIPASRKERGDVHTRSIQHTTEGRSSCWHSEDGNVTPKRNGTISYRFSHALRAITIKSYDVSYEPRAITLRSDNDFHMPRSVTIKSNNFSPQC